MYCTCLWSLLVDRAQFNTLVTTDHDHHSLSRIDRVWAAVSDHVMPQ